MCMRHLTVGAILATSDDSVGVVVVLDSTFKPMLNKPFLTVHGGYKCSSNSLEKYL